MTEKFFFRCTSILFFAFSLSIWAQESYDKANLYRLFDDTIGNENTDLYKGLVYREEYRTINELTPFFLNSRFNSGTVHYDGQSYYKEDLKYDVYRDELLLKVRDKVGGITIQLLKEYVQGFSFLNRRFVHLSKDKSKDIGESGFFEEAFSGSKIGLYVKHSKRIYERKNRKFIYYEFREAKGTYYIFFNGYYYRIQTKNDVIAILPELEESIDGFYKSAGRLRKKDPYQFMTALVKKLEVQI